MPRNPRVEMAGYHHVINRGVEQRNVFLDEADFNAFLKARGQVIVIVYAIMLL